MPSSSPWKESVLRYFQADLGMDLNQTISLPRAFIRTAHHHAKKAALKDKENGAYVSLTYGELNDRVHHFAASLMARGFQQGDRVAILLKNSSAWVISDFGTMFAGGTTVPIYGTMIATAVRHILKDSGASFIVVEDAEQFEKIQEIWKDLPDLKAVIVRRSEGLTLTDDRIVSFDNFLKQGQGSVDSKLVEKRAESVRRDDVASIVYTSGTTGDPKGVMLTHKNFLSNVYGLVSVSDIGEDDTMLSLLPLSHVFERTVGYYIAILMGATIAYAESLETVSQNLLEIQPTICIAVPRLFEKIYTRILQGVEAANPIRRRLFQWALNTGRLVAETQDDLLRAQRKDRRQNHRPEDRNFLKPPTINNTSLRLSYALAEKLVYSKVRQSFGGRLRFFVSGGAPLSADITRFFRYLGIRIYEGYGLTESSPVISFNFGNKFKPGTIGKLLPHVQVKFSGEGEILVKGPNVMKGYHNQPEATRQAIDENGWLHTGDIGMFDEDNYLKITDRVKELIVMSNGKNVAPLPIENKLTHSPLVAQAMVVGNNHRYISALLFPSYAELKTLARSFGVESSSFEDLCRNEKVRERFTKLVDDVNLSLSRFEQIKKFEIIPHELTIQGGDVTPTLKLKRRVLEKKFKDVIEKFYAV